MVSEDGRVAKRRSPGKYRKPSIDKDGYHRLQLFTGGVTHNFNIQRIVWEAFNG